MKIFLDTANIEQIKEFAFILDGVTTNPTLAAREGKTFKEVIPDICKIVDGPISAEVLSLDSKGMIKEAREMSKWHKNVVIKIPMTIEGIKAIKQLSKEGIRTNCTLVFSANQALLAAKAGATYVSPFVGRLDDIGQDGMQVVAEILDVFDNYEFDTQVIVASVRHPNHVKQAALLGADIATVPYEVLKKMFSHALTDKGIKAFLDDYKKVEK
ncbi:MAG: fructose-6-phosphate aldolase [Candidatus Diapherotrites archaeon]|nr:fructose-6-phosphate aldolase [Candidatus Diapherotrites archaeon]